MRRRWWRRAGFTLLEVLAALGLVGAVGVMATGAGHALAHLGLAARAEAAGLLAAEQKLEELLAARSEDRTGGTDAVDHSGIAVRRVWRVLPNNPAPGLERVEVSARWDVPRLTVLTLVAVAP